MENIACYFTNISLATYVVVFIGGLAASFTPCVYPLIPIIVGVIGTSKEVSRLRNFILSVSYVLGMALTFSILGMISALTGRLFGQLQSSALAHLIVGNIIILFALVLLGVLPLPTSLLSKIGSGRTRTGGGVLPVFLMGLVSGLVVAPCTLAVLGALLAYVATTQSIFFGFTLLFTFALGLGTLLMILGTFVGILTGLPRLAGKMEIVQKLLALAMILLGEYFIFRAGLLSI